jgi:hypothetical protein
MIKFFEDLALVLAALMIATVLYLAFDGPAVYWP